MTFYIEKTIQNLQGMVVHKKSLFRSLFLIFIFSNFLGFGQSEIDSLQQKSYEELLNIFNNEPDLRKRKIYAKAWIKKAKIEKNRKKIVVGYYNSSQLYEDITKLTYCDSIISLTSENSYDFYPTLAYLTKAYFYHEKGDYKNAVDNYLLANKFAKKHKNIDLILDSNYSIGTIKRKIGEYEEALKLYRENIPYARKVLAKNNNSNYYLTTLMAISNIFYELKSVDSASYYNKLGVVESLKFNNESSFHHFSVNEGIVNYLKGNFNIAIDSIKKHNHYFRKVNARKNLSYTYYYLGKSYAAKNEKIKSINNFKKVDSIFQIENDVSPSIRESYETLISHYKQNKNLEKQLFYVNRLMKFDSIINDNNSYLNKKIFKEYDIPKLISEKKSILNQMEAKEEKFDRIIFFISTILLITISALIIQYRKRNIYKRRFEEIINRTEPVKPISETILDNKINIPNETIENILSHLNFFEKTHEFISNKISLNYLSKKLNTNSNYLSKVINQYKRTSFSNYINNLRIEYVIVQLKTNSIYRKYTIKAIAQEVGFNNSESFSKAFHKTTGIKPSYFIKELEKID